MQTNNAAASKNCISITLKVLVLSLALSHVLFSLAFLKLMYKVLGAESCSSGDTQLAAAAAHSQPINPHQKKPSIKKPPHQKKPCVLLQ
jgi:hypothetical protein